MSAQYRIFDWYLKNPTNYTKEKYNGVDCGVLSVNEETEYNTDSYFYNIINVFPNDIGNTFSAKIAIDTDSSADMSIEDGTYLFNINIGAQGVEVGGDVINLDTSIIHDYWMCLKGDEAKLYIDNHLTWKGTPSTSSTNQMHKIGFMNYAEGTSKLYINILRCTYGEKHPIDFDNLQFEVQVDTIDTFDSVNLKTYYNVGSDVFCREDDTVKSVAYGDKLARAFRIPLIPRQPDMPYFFFFRVRVLGDDANSDWAYCMYNRPDNPFMYDTKVILETIFGVKENMVVFCLENNSSYIFVKGESEEYDGENLIKCAPSEGYWKKVSNSYFMLDPDLTDTIWNHMLEDRLPSTNVYTKYKKSGNISATLESDAIMMDKVRTQILKAIRNSSINSASDEVLENNFGKKYNLTKENFGNILEYRYALLAIQNAFCLPGEYNQAISIFESITGVKPGIFEYKSMLGWVILDDEDFSKATPNEKYALFDDSTLYPDFNEAVLYSDNELAFGFDISIYNPFDIKMEESVVKEIVRMFKPAATSANIIMHDVNGREYQYPGYYYFANYGADLYYPSELSEQ